MKKLFTIVAVAVVSLSFTSCRQDDESADMTINSKQENTQSFGKTADSVKTDTVKTNARPVDPDPPVKDGTSW